MKFAQLTGQKGWIAEEHPVKFEDYEKKIKPYVDAYLKKVGNRGISDINIAKEKIGMPEHLTPPPKKTYVAPASPHEGGDGGGYQPTTRAQNVARTASRVGPGGQVKAYGLAHGGLMDIPFPGRRKDI